MAAAACVPRWLARRGEARVVFRADAKMAKGGRSGDAVCIMLASVVVAGSLSVYSALNLVHVYGQVTTRSLARALHTPSFPPPWCATDVSE